MGKLTNAIAGAITVLSFAGLMSELAVEDPSSFGVFAWSFLMAAGLLVVFCNAIDEITKAIREHKTPPS